MRCLRKIIDVTWPDVRILEICQSSNLTTLIRKRRLRWIGHVSRIEGSRIPKCVLFGELSTGRRSVGLPRLRSKDSIKRDLTDFEIPVDTWKRVAADGGTWRSMIGVGVGCSSKNFELLRWRQHIARQRRRDSEIQIINSDGSQE